jgi:Uma2 family endonuclease
VRFIYKRAEYAAAGIPHYWIAQMTNNNGPAISVERLLLAYDGQYISQELRVRGRDFRAVDTVTPFRLELTWEQLDDGLLERPAVTHRLARSAHDSPMQ